MSFLKSVHFAKAFFRVMFFTISALIPNAAHSQDNKIVKPDTKGFLLPQMTAAQRDALINPFEGTVIYNTTDKKPQFYNGTRWKFFDVNGHYIGERFAGGIVFYVDSTSEHGMIVAPADQNSAPWGIFEKEVGAHGKTIGTGASNTEMVSKAHSQPDIAASICNDLVINGYSDWYLPSIEELNMVYRNIKLIGLGNFANEEYWSSTETDFNNAWLMNFSTGFPIENHTDRVLRVRAIRNF